MPVTILDAWDQEDDYGQNGATFAVSAGSRRCAIVFVGAESNQGSALGVSGVTLGGQAMTVQTQDTVGSTSEYHNYGGIWTLPESGISAMSGSTITVTWSNFTGQGPFSSSPAVQYASYQDVDQGNINASGTGENTNTSAGNISPASTINVAADEKVVVLFVAGQQRTPTETSGGLTEEAEYIGTTNDMVLSAYHRTATTADASYTWTVTITGSNTRLQTRGFALGFDGGAAGWQPYWSPRMTQRIIGSGVR